MVRIDGFLMDLAVSEEYEFPGEATKFPAEVGSDFTDHIRDMPPEITIECIVSDTPIGVVATERADQVATFDEGEPVPLPSVEALARLRDMKARRLPVVIETSLGIFDNMALTTLTVPVDKEKSLGTKDQPGALFFTAKFQQINVVTNKRTRTRVRSNMAGAGGAGKAKTKSGTPWPKGDIYTWLHGVPAGTPFRAGNKREAILIQYDKPTGLTLDESTALAEAVPETVLIKYFYTVGNEKAGQEIIGIPRLDLVKDIKRDIALQRAKRAAQAKAAADGAAAEAALASPDRRPIQNLPDGVDLARFQRPAPVTLPTPIAPPTL